MKLSIKRLWRGDLYRLAWWKSSWRQFVKVALIAAGVGVLSFCGLLVIVVIVVIVIVGS